MLITTNFLGSSNDLGCDETINYIERNAANIIIIIDTSISYEVMERAVA